METEIVNAFLESLQIKGYRQITIDEYRMNLSGYTRFLEARQIASFFAASFEIITAYYIAAKEKEYTPKTIWKKQHAVYTFYEWLKGTDSLLVNPCPRAVVVTAVRLPKAVPAHNELEKTYCKLRMSNKLWEQRNYHMVDLAYSCGLRRCELHALNITDVNENEGVLLIKGKGGKERIVPIGPKALKELCHYMYHIRPKFIKSSLTKALFLSWQKGGTRINARSINKAFCTLRRKYGLSEAIAPHALRHAFATELIRNGAPVQNVSEMLGHAKLETTQIYIRLTVTDLKKHHKTCHPRG